MEKSLVDTPRDGGTLLSPGEDRTALTPPNATTAPHARRTHARAAIHRSTPPGGGSRLAIAVACSPHLGSALLRLLRRHTSHPLTSQRASALPCRPTRCTRAPSALHRGRPTLRSLPRASAPHRVHNCPHRCTKAPYPPLTHVAGAAAEAAQQQRQQGQGQQQHGSSSSGGAGSSGRLGGSTGSEQNHRYLCYGSSKLMCCVMHVVLCQRA